MLLGPTEKRHYKWVEFDVGSFLVQWGFSARTPISPSKTNISKFPYHHRLQNSPYFLRIQVGASRQTKGLKRGWKRRARLGRDRERLALFARVRFLSYAKTILRKKNPTVLQSNTIKISRRIITTWMHFLALPLHLKRLYNVGVNLKISGFRMFVDIWRTAICNCWFLRRKENYRALLKQEREGKTR